MKISAHPLVVAAALGLLGPAALTDDDALDDALDGLAGTWSLDDEAEPEGPCPAERADCADGPLDPALVASLELGPTLELIPVEDRVLIDVPSQGSLSWSRDGEVAAHHELRIDGAHITRSLAVEGDALRLRTVIERGGQRHARERRYSRVG